MNSSIKLPIFILSLLFISAIAACNGEKETKFNVRYIKSNGLKFKIVESPSYESGFFMREDNGKKTSCLYVASTPFFVDKITENKIFTIQVGKENHKDGNLFEFDLKVDFNEEDADDVMKLTGRNTKWRNGSCIDVGAYLSIYIKITVSPKNIPVFEKTESHICGVGHTKNSVHKNIATLRLKPGIYTVQVENRARSLAFRKYALSLLVRQAY